MPGFTRCSDCLVDLVDALPEPGPPDPGPTASRGAQPLPPRTDPPERFALVTVFATSDPGLMPIAKSLLQSAQIPFVVEGDAIQDLFGIGRMGAYNPITGPAALKVAPQDAGDARAVLADLRTNAAGDDVART